MKILSHRGYWKTPQEKNTVTAFRRSFTLGFGTETDIRDLGGALVISHDPPQSGVLPLDRFLELHREISSDLPLAINVKADGLQALLKKSFEEFAVSDYFVFDMSVPDLLGYLRAGIPFFTRMSEYEREPALLGEAAGVWLDGFHGEWYSDSDLLSLINVGKKLCLVSPELHGRPYHGMWERLRALERQGVAGITLCTDHPEEARDFFR